MKLEWNVYIEDPNAKSFRKYNALSGYGDYFIKEYIHTKGNKEKFLERVRLIMQSRYWSRCEYELILTGWPNANIQEKIDVYDQLMMNWYHFSEYVWKWTKREVKRSVKND